MKKLGGSQNFFMRNRGVTKKSRDYWVATNFNKNFVKWNSPKMHIFRATRIGGYIFLQHCSSGWRGGHKIFDHQIEGVTKILPRSFRKFMTPLFQRYTNFRNTNFYFLIIYFHNSLIPSVTFLFLPGEKIRSNLEVKLYKCVLGVKVDQLRVKIHMCKWEHASLVLQENLCNRSPWFWKLTLHTLLYILS